MDMPKWRETALEMLPEFADDISEAETPYLLWFSLRDAFEKAYDGSPRDETLISRIYAYSDWCVRSPRGETVENDLFTCVAVCFLEHIPEHPQARADMPRWFTLEQLLSLKHIFGYHIGDQSFADLEECFRRNAQMNDQCPPRAGPDVQASRWNASSSRPGSQGSSSGTTEYSRPSMPINHERFLSMLGAEFPEVIAGFSPTEGGLLHCEVGAFRRSVEEAMDTGRLCAERYFRFIDHVLMDAEPEVHNAIEISFLEDLALGDFTPARQMAVRERMPRALRKMLEVVDQKWR